MAKFKDFVSYPKDGKGRDLIPVGKESKSTRATDESLPAELPQSATLNVAAFRDFMHKALERIEDRNVGLRWLDTLKAKSVVKNQRAFLGEIRRFEQEVTAWVGDKTARTTAETEHVEAQTRKKIAEHRHASIDKDLLIRDKEQDVKIAELEYQEAKWKEKRKELGRPKPSPARAEEAKPETAEERTRRVREEKRKLGVVEREQVILELDALKNEKMVTLKNNGCDPENPRNSARHLQDFCLQISNAYDDRINRLIAKLHEPE